MKNKRKLLQWLVLSLILVLWFRAPAIAQTAKHYTDLSFPPLGEVKLPKYERYELKNGMVVYLVEDHKLPLVSGTAMIKTGSRLEPGAKTGLGEITGTVWRSGGTKNYNPDELNRLLEQRAATIETAIGTNSGSASFNSLREDLPQVFPLFAEVIQNPAFNPQQIALAQTQQKGEIARRNDDPDDIASREFRKLIYGASSPYARTVEFATLGNISRDNLIQFHETYVRPERMILGIVGDFDSGAMKGTIEKYFGSWQPLSAANNISIPPAQQKFKGGLFVVDQPHLSQSTILMGQLGGRLDSPDYPALSVLNEVLSGFGGRLFNEVRSKQGLAYSVYGVWNASYDVPGIFIAGGQTRSDASVPFIKSVFSEIERIRTEPITAQELEDAKNSILNSFVFKFENPGQTVSRLMTYEYYGYPSDFIFRYQKAVKAVTIEDIKRVANQYLQPQQMVTLVVGNTKEINPSLTSLEMPITNLDVTIAQQ
ncbi:MAG: hypothetical protein N5P05_003292 [Chroococcopsis gigantea SAG 12.99]|jgi:zinc protease|nr:insulinase family protein [Chlorogloea purpurea SAG 13.99]MDV3001686.1 hypothetical protein [Chroococcopsis gigantea SAG 12.99]